jgi:FlaA1/EpsC-like NDP-sugar epimerase
MTIPEAVRLILHAGAIGKAGDIHVLNMGSPIRIVDLARDVIRLALPDGGKDIDIVFTGLRPGEKMEETLFAEGETAVSADPYVLVARREGSVPSKASLISQLEALACDGQDEHVRRLLLNEDTERARDQLAQ